MSSVALARAYQHSFEAHPYGTLALTNGALNALGDIVAQVTQNLIQPPPTHRRDDHSYNFDYARTVRFFAFGVAMGPIIGRWNFFLERHFPLRKSMVLKGHLQESKVSMKALAKRVAADQLLMAPAGLVFFIGSMGIMEGRDKKHVQDKFRELYIPLLKTNWQVWPVAQLINFRFMPLAYRVPFQSTCGVFWTLYLSIANSKENQHAKHDDSLRQTLG
ncbi:hypothetical protein BDY19DRAFT_430348 [Irpex rosettiformis]|uniref:Uncharacterized protein n=1 Tax=Irpex rosettiformis TaxID=378272 RepID=A0ACB8TU79_9APHY|nr:hypothetical protein BDY19DRAFT_430348 [Irpex rosettiformis]